MTNWRLHRAGEKPRIFRATRLSSLVSNEDIDDGAGIILDTFWCFCDDEKETATDELWIDGDIIEQVGAGFGRSRLYMMTPQGDIFEVEEF